MSPRLYFANLCADVSRCIKARQDGDAVRYEDSLLRAWKTLSFLRTAHRPEAYEEGLLLLRGLQLLRKDELARFSMNVDRFAAELVS